MGEDMQNRVSEIKPNQSYSVAIRIFFLAAIIAVCFCLLCYNLLKMQVFNHEELRQKAAEQQMRDITITPDRGTIYDANMKILATSATVWTVSISPKDIKEPQREKIAFGLSEILEVDVEKIFAKIDNVGSYYELIKAKIDKPVADIVRSFAADNSLKGIYLHQDSKRYYPYGDFCASILGFTGAENQGLAGIESYYDKELTGVAGRVVAAKNGWGNDLPFDYEASYDPVDGNSLVLTIDETIQHYLEKHLTHAVEYHNVEARGVGIVMDVNTGAVLAMATKKDYDPNKPFEIYDEEIAAAIELLPQEEQNAVVTAARNEQWRNKAVSDLYEPGSVFKLVTAGAALDSGAATLLNNYQCAGSFKVGPETMRCAQTAGHGNESFSQALVNSCNPAFIQIGAQIGSERFYDYFNGFGLAKKTGIDISGEAQSIFYNAKTLGPVELASSSFGQSIKITPLQMITAIATIANGGNLVQPHLVSRVIDADGNIVKTLTPEPKRQVISEMVAKEILNIMEISVSGAPGFSSPGKNAYVMGHRVGGKSGTSQKLDKDGGESLRIASFGAVAPANDPQIAVLIILDEPHSYSTYGGVLAAPVAGSILAEALPYLNIEPQYSEEEQQQVEATLPSVTNLSLTDAQVKLQKFGFITSVSGPGSTVISQFPQSGEVLARGSTVILNTLDQEPPQLVSVPNLVGKNDNTASKLVATAGLNLKRTGAAIDSNVTIISQSIEPGERVSIGTAITVTFQDHSLVD